MDREEEEEESGTDRLPPLSWDSWDTAWAHNGGAVRPPLSLKNVTQFKKKGLDVEKQQNYVRLRQIEKKKKNLYDFHHSY